MYLGRLCVVPQRLHIQADRKTLVGNGNVNQRRSQDAIDHRVGLVERSCLAGEPVEKLLVLVERSEGRPLTPQNVDIAGEPDRRVFRNLV